jgi:hypothetical protein
MAMAAVFRFVAGRVPSLALALLLAAAGVVRADPAPPTPEPTFCKPDTFFRHEIRPSDDTGLDRLRMFRIGDAVFAGMAIGTSESRAVARLASEHGAGKADRLCTWYVNRGMTEAEQLFHHSYLSHPTSQPLSAAIAEYSSFLKSAIAPGRDGLLECLADTGYVAVGCNGQLHRGPTVFGMVLAYAGCTPAHALEIVNRIWGANGIPPGTRREIFRASHTLGAEQPAARERILRRLLEAPAGAEHAPATRPAP